MQPLSACEVEKTGGPDRQPDVELFAWHLDDDRHIELRVAAASLSSEELARAERFHFDLHRNRYIRGRGYLRLALGQVLGIPAQSIALIDGAHGKPALKQGGLWFNLSNSAGSAVLILSRHGEVGIDLELASRNVDITALAESCFVDEEIAALNAVSGAAQVARFFVFWTAKEARMKLTGEGMHLQPKSIRLALNDDIPVACISPTSPAVRFHYSAIAGAHSFCCYAVLEDHPCRA